MHEISVVRAHSLTPTKVKKVTSGQMSLMTVAWNFLTLHSPPEKMGLAETILKEREQSTFVNGNNAEKRKTECNDEGSDPETKKSSESTDIQRTTGSECKEGEMQLTRSFYKRVLFLDGHYGSAAVSRAQAELRPHQ